MSDENTTYDAGTAGSAGSPDVTGVALGAVPEDETRSVREAAESDAELASELDAMDEVAAHLALLVPQRTINRGRSAGIRSRLLARAVQSRGGRSGPPGSMPVTPAYERQAAPITAGASGDSDAAAGRGDAGVGAGVGAGAGAGVGAGVGAGRHAERGSRRSSGGRGGGRMGNWLALAASLALVATAAQLWRVSSERDSLRQNLGARVGGYAQQVSALQSAVAKRDSAIAALTGPDMKVVELTSRASRDPAARMFWNRKTQQWTMYAYNLSPPPAGRTYQVWLITSGAAAPVSAGTFTPGAGGSAVLEANYPLARDALLQVAVTEEPAGGVPAPTGRMVIAGTVAR